ncbi:hypothetical protein ABW09_12215 [Pluralibacter gergoviae]|nr:hypothetical protein ABW09_12215 [Pluralibacter gergoviae]
MTNHSQVESLPVVTYNSTPVLTTELLAQLYGTESVRIQQNHKRNAGRFTAGKHFFKVTGEALKSLRLSFSESQNPVSPKTRALILWTERGAARHAKMLETDQAWEVFEKLEDFYFSQKEKAEQARKTRQCSATQLTPLRQTAERLITTGIGNIYPDIWKLVHQRFDVEHIHQLQPEQVGEAIEYLDALEGEFLGKQEVLPAPKLELPSITMEWWYRNNMQMRHDNPERRDRQAWNDVTLTPAMMHGDGSQSPTLHLIQILEQMGFDMVGPRIEVEAMRIMLGKGEQRIRVMGDGRVKYLLSL